MPKHTPATPLTGKEMLLAKAAEYRAEAERSIATAHILNNWTNYDRAIAEAKTYEWLASVHPKVRMAWMRRNWGSAALLRSLGEE
jgi:hypothetical protein